MKKFAFTTLILLCTPFLSSAQKDNLKQTTIYRTRITLINGSVKRGDLYQTTDSSVLTAKSIGKLNKMNLISVDSFLTSINYIDIRVIEVRKKSSRGKGALIGLLAGSLGGATLGAIVLLTEDTSENPYVFTLGPTPTEAAVIFSISGALYGTAIGAQIGSRYKIKIPVSGSFEKFSENRASLRRYSYIQ